MFAKIENGIVVKTAGDIRQEFPNTSFPAIISADHLPAGWVIVQPAHPPTVAANEQAVPGMPILSGGVWVQGYEVLTISASEKIAQDNMVAALVRADRDARIAETDWTQAKDILDSVSSKYAVYRQALRDVPTQPGFPYSVNWPVKPV